MAVTAEVKDRVGWITLDRPPDNSYDAAFLEELGHLLASEDAREGLTAATERRPPSFSGI